MSTTFSKLKNKFFSKLTILLFLLPAFVPVILFVFTPLFFSLIIAIYKNPGLVTIQQDLIGYYANLDNLSLIKWGDFLWNLSRKKSHGVDIVTDVFILITVILVIVSIFVFIKILNKSKFFKERPLFSYLTAVMIAVVSPFIFELIYFRVLLLLTDSLVALIEKTALTTLPYNIAFAPLNNFSRVFNSIRIDFIDILINTIFWTTVCVFFHVVLGLFLAMLMNKKFPARGIFRTIFILPWAIPQFVTALIFRNYVFNFQQGIIGRPFQKTSGTESFVFTSLDFLNILLVIILLVILTFVFISYISRYHALEKIRYGIYILVFIILLYTLVLIIPATISGFIDFTGIRSLFTYKIIEIPKIKQTFWFTSDIFVLGRQFKSVLFSSILVNIWLGVPFMMVSFLAALQSIPQDLYEAAKIDGASTWTQFRTITFPLIKPTLFTVSLLGFVWTFNLFNVVYIMSQGQSGIGQSKYYDIFVTYIFYFFTQRSDYATAASLSFVVFMMLVMFSWAYRRLLNPEKIFEGQLPKAKEDAKS